MNVDVAYKVNSLQQKDSSLVGFWQSEILSPLTFTLYQTDSFMARKNQTVHPDIGCIRVALP